MPEKKVFALLVSDQANPLEKLKTILKSQEIEAWSVTTCAEAERLLEQTHPELIFTDTTLSDGTWMDVVCMAEKAAVPTNAIVVGKNQDIKLYLSTMDSGASDFILPPFEPDPIAHVVRVAAENVRRQREKRALQAVA